MKLKAPETVFSSAGFCPGCGHGLATRLIGEVSEELGIQEKMLAVVDVACCSFNIDYWRYDTIMAAHGRDIPTAVGVKHIRPENPVFAYPVSYTHLDVYKRQADGVSQRRRRH